MDKGWSSEEGYLLNIEKRPESCQSEGEGPKGGVGVPQALRQKRDTTEIQPAPTLSPGNPGHSCQSKNLLSFRLVVWGRGRPWSEGLDRGGVKFP